MSAPSILNVIRLAKDFYREGVSVLPTTAGTGPMHLLVLCWHIARSKLARVHWVLGSDHKSHPPKFDLLCHEDWR